MKKCPIRIITLLVIACFSALPAMAQLGEVRNNLAVGINGGLNMSKVDFSPSIKQNSLNGMSFGVTARYISEKYFKMLCGIQVELNYSQRGWDEKIEDGSNNTYSRTMNYLEIPLLAHLAFGKDATDRGVRFFLNLGPQFGLFLSEKEEMSDNWDVSARPNGVTQQYGKMVENKFDYGIVGGGGLEVSTGIGHFLLEGRYYYGLSDFYKSTKKDEFGRSGHSYIGVRLTYLFDIIK
ncbi:MAG: PorT family protein [Bacteroidaceae bacterium]|nr:PorT family protein [Bacteroidaceae bacterium]